MTKIARRFAILAASIALINIARNGSPSPGSRSALEASFPAVARALLFTLGVAAVAL